MIKFFRKIRQQLLSENKFSKYLIYAIGEIVLVVIGILIALQINNWNENRKARIKSVEYHTRLLDDLDRTITTSGNLNETAVKVLTSIKHMIDVLDTKKIPDENDKQQIDYALIWILRFNYQFSEQSTFEEMKSNGEMGLIYNLETRNNLVNFHEYTVSVDAIFNRLGASITNNSTFKRHILSEVDPITLNITNHYDLTDMANDKEFINELSQFSVHWRGNAWFTSQIERKAIDLKNKIQIDLDQLK